MKEESFRHVYRFGRFELQPEERRLLDSGVPLDIHSRALDVLAVLAARPDQLVTKSELLDVAWPNLVVEENNLHVQISTLRKVLGVDAIATVAGRGYRFAWPVDRVTTGAGALVYQRHNLPTQATTFVGRTRELDEAKALLGHARLLTVTGPGGVGKTRFALRLAEDVRADYPDGAWLVELGALRDPSMVAAAVARALGIQDPRQDIASHVQALRLLLILDNCEHLIGAAAQLVGSMLAKAADVRILATSRESLRIDGEQCFALRPLALPPPDAAPDEVERSEAVSLFVDRARLQSPDFSPNASQAAVVAALCSHLDGIPLAIELAASRMAHSSVEEIHSLLRDRFSLLAHGTRTALPRHQTMRAAIDWSYDLLGERERKLLRRLSVFAGTFSLDAATRVAGDDEAELREALWQLVACSLLHVDARDSRTRYRLLETTRVYALEKLEASGEAPLVKRRHAEHCAEQSRRAAEDWYRIPDGEWHAKYDLDPEDVRRALDWAFGEGGDARIGALLASSDAMPPTESARWVEAAFATGLRGVPDADQARLWERQSTLRRLDASACIAAKERSVALYRQVGDVLSLALALGNLSEKFAYGGRLDEAEHALAEAELLLPQSGFPKLRAVQHAQRAYVELCAGRSRPARRNFEQARRLFLEVGSTQVELHHSVIGCARTSWFEGDFAAACAHYHEAVAIARTLPGPLRRRLGMSLCFLAGALARIAQVDDSLQAAREGLPLVRGEIDVYGALDHVAPALAAAGRVPDALRLSGFADREYEATTLVRQPVELRMRQELQELAAVTHQPAEVERLLSEGAALTKEAALALAMDALAAPAHTRGRSR